MDEKFKAIIGLGNPGKKYEETYHNAGRLFLGFLATVLDASEMTIVRKNGFGYRKADSVFLVESRKFMNESGEMVVGALKYFKLKPKDILIAHDDADLPLGKWKISKESGAAGHRGVSSIISALKTKKIARLRIGIRPSAEIQKRNVGLPAEIRRMKAGEFVLKKIKPKERLMLEKTFGAIARYFTERSGKST